MPFQESPHSEDHIRFMRETIKTVVIIIVGMLLSVAIGHHYGFKAGQKSNTNQHGKSN